MAPDNVYPPDRRHLEAQLSCDACGLTFGRFTFPITATLAAGDDSASAPVGIPADACPHCGAPVATDVDLQLD